MSSFDFKILLQVNSINYKISLSSDEPLISHFKSLHSSISFQELIELISLKHPSSFDLLKSNDWVLEIFDTDFNEYVLLDENSSIDNLSKVRLYLPNSHSNLIKNKTKCSKRSLTPVDPSNFMDESNSLLFDKIHERSKSPKFLSLSSNTAFEKKFDKHSSFNSNTRFVSPFGSCLSDFNQKVHESSSLNNNNQVSSNNDTVPSSESCISPLSEAGSDNVLALSNQYKNQLCLHQSENSNSLQSDLSFPSYQFDTSRPSCSSSGLKQNTKLHSKPLLFTELHSSNICENCNESSHLTNNQSSKDFSTFSSPNNKTSQNTFNSKSEIEDDTKEAKPLMQDFDKILYDTDFHISSFNEKIKICEIFQKYNKSFACTSKKIDVWGCDEIWDKINIELIRQGIDVDIKSEFAQLLCQYTNIITYLAGWSEEECQKLWPLFSIFHNELSLTPFNPEIDNLINTFVSKSNNNTSTRLATKKEITNNETKYVQSEKAIDLKNLKLFLTNFTIRKFEEKKMIVDTICKHFSSLNYNHKKPKEFFDAISKIMNTKHKDLHFKSHLIRNAFEGLLGQYLAILKNLKNWRSTDCQKLWPFFNTFHFDLDINQYKPVAIIQNEFIKHPKINAWKMYGHLLKTPKDKKVINEDLLQIEDLKSNANDLNEKEKRLLQVVFKNTNESTKNCSKEDFWKKIAYEMSNYESPLNQSSHFGWKKTFYSLINSYIAEINSDVIGKCRKNNHLFQNQDLSPFLTNFEKNSIIDKHSSGFYHVERYDQTDKSKKNVKKVPLKESQVNFSQSQNLHSNELIPDYLKHQYTFIKIIKKHLKNRCKPEKFWKRVYSEVTASGYNLNPNIDLRDYFKSMLQVYLQVMRVSDNYFIAINTWPFFKSLDELDFSLFFDDVQEYYQLKSKFVERFGKTEATKTKEDIYL